MSMMLFILVKCRWCSAGFWGIMSIVLFSVRGKMSMILFRVCGKMSMMLFSARGKMSMMLFI